MGARREKRASGEVKPSAPSSRPTCTCHHTVPCTRERWTGRVGEGGEREREEREEKRGA